MPRRCVSLGDSTHTSPEFRATILPFMAQRNQHPESETVEIALAWPNKMWSAEFAGVS
jgi:hypothetical protein